MMGALCDVVRAFISPYYYTCLNAHPSLGYRSFLKLLGFNLLA